MARSSMMTNCVTAVMAALSLMSSSMIEAAPDEQFKDVEIRVIKEKYFQKSGRLELGAQASVVMNQSFIYTYMGTGILTYHFNESFALEGAGTYGFTIDKEDKRILSDQFSVFTEILRPEYLLDGALQWTPMYGKFHTPSGRLIYFDTYLSAGGGMEGIYYKYDWCYENAIVKSKPTARTVSYPSFQAGIGQRIFLDKKKAIKWDLRDRIISYNLADSSCTADTVGSQLFHNVTMQIGMGYYF